MASMADSIVSASQRLTAIDCIFLSSFLFGSSYHRYSQNILIDSSLTLTIVHVLYTPCLLWVFVQQISLLDSCSVTFFVPEKLSQSLRSLKIPPIFI